MPGLPDAEDSAVERKAFGNAYQERKDCEEIADLFCEQCAVNGAYMWEECAAFSFLLEVQLHSKKG